MRVVLASNNVKKMAELRTILEPSGIALISQSELNIPEASEPYPSFVENALAKARHASRLSQLPAIADDSGLCVSALANAPGVRSARFAGDKASDCENNALLLEKLARVGDRRAFFYCVIVMVMHADDARPLIAEGEWHGHIAHQASGTGGFGYDPLFYGDGLEITAGELSSTQKNLISHRAQALAKLRSRIGERRG